MVKLLSKKGEKRMYNTSIEVRESEENQPKVLEGYAAVFNQRTTIEGYFEEMILPGAFSKTLTENKDVIALVNHNFDNVLGRTSNALLKLFEDDYGLKFELHIPEDDEYAAQIYKKVKNGNLKDCSFLFLEVVEEWDYSTELPLRILHEVDLIEISLVTLPAYEGTEVSARSKAKASNGAQRTQMKNKIKHLLGDK